MAAASVAAVLAGPEAAEGYLSRPPEAAGDPEHTAGKNDNTAADAAAGEITYTANKNDNTAADATVGDITC
jgi:hypothetical protein